MPGPAYADLAGLFPDPAGPPVAMPVTGDTVPEPYHSLLVHTHHMTVTVEDFYGGPVDVRVLDSRLDGDVYSRKILLALRDGRVVQSGVVRIHLATLAPIVRQHILEQKTPLGRVLIEHDVFRRVEPTAYLRVVPDAAMCEWFGLREPAETFGRLGVIHCDGEPAIEVMEVLAPVGHAPRSAAG